MCPAVGGTATVGRRHTWVPPYREIYKTRVGAAALPRPFPRFSSAQVGRVEPRPYAGQDDLHEKCHSEERSDVGIRFPRVAGVQYEGITDCHTGVRAGAQ